ncbi:MAG: DNA alkylation repair protein [Chloroflexi bacterium]|nr:DNA alkylation repair protein [Chloroflexota bacterium]
MKPVIDLDNIAHQLALAGTSERAPRQKAYLKSDLDFFGTAVPDIRAVLKNTVRVHPAIRRTELLQLSLNCFDSSYFEMHLFGVFLLDRYGAVLEQADLRHIETIVRMCKTWALVDPLSNPGAELVDRGMPEAGPILDEWSVDENFWLRRISMLVLMPGLRRDQEYWDRFVGYADSMIEEREFFIRKAIGWVLRDMSKVRPKPVGEYVRRHIAVMSGVTFREAVKYLPEPEQSELRAAFKDR